MTSNRVGLNGARSNWKTFYARSRGVPEMLRWAGTHADLVERLLAAQSVLEVGTGTATLVAMASRWADPAVSIDLDRSVLATARETGDRLRSRARLVQGDAFALPFRSGAFEVAFSQGLLEHFSDEDARQLVEEQRRVASRVLVSVPGRLYPHMGRWGPGLIGNERLLGVDAWERVFAGLDVTVHRYRDPKTFTVAGCSFGPKIHLLFEIRGR